MPCNMAHIQRAVRLILFVVITKYVLSNEESSSEFYCNSSSSLQVVGESFETQKILTNSKTRETNVNFQCNKHGGQCLDNTLLLARSNAGSTLKQRETEVPSLQTAKEGVQREDILLKLTRIDPVEVGYVRELNLVPGKVHKMKTLSLRPALFEIEDFLTEQECNDIILMAQTQGLERSMTLGEQSLEENLDDNNETSLPDLDPAEKFKQLDSNSDGHLDAVEIAGGLIELGRVIVNEDETKKMISDLDMDPDKDGVITYEEFLGLLSDNKMKEMMDYLQKIHETSPNKRIRDSKTAFLDPYEHIDFKPFFESLRDRVHLVTHLPKDMIWSSENMQVIKYQEKQHYHCHYDSEEEEAEDKPCCHHVENMYDGEEKIECIPCRFLTFFYYLNEPTLGGETAFPIADNETIAEEKIKPRSYLSTTYMERDLNKCDLAEHCYDANLYYKPKRGAALLWYNHFVSNETGWLGPVDQMSYHGGCNVIEGTKWAANNWINAGIDRKIDLKLWEEVRLMEQDFQERMTREPWEEQTGQKKSNEINNEEASSEGQMIKEESKGENKQTIN